MWTVNWRIFFGYGVLLLFVAVMAWVGWLFLGETEAVLADAFKQRRQQVAPSLEVESEVRGANAEYLRYIVQPSGAHLMLRDSMVANARSLIRQLHESAEPDQRQAWTESDRMLADWDAAMRESVAAQQQGNREDALRIRDERVSPIRVRLEQTVRSARQTAISRADSAATVGAASASAYQRNLALLGFGILVLGLVISYLLARSVRRPMQETANLVATSAAQILAAATEQAASANQTLAAVSESVATVDEVTQSADQAAQRAKAVAESAQRTAEIARTGRKAVGDSVTAMDTVREQVESIGESILTLAEQAQAIGEIITAVNDIAEQTNILALNAAVEAARAGEQGRGFAVVAGEVKSLAEQSKRSTVQIRQILGEIQRATSAAVMSTERGTKQVKDASRQVTEAGATIRSLTDAVSDAAQSASQIVASAGQQAIGMEQIRQAVGSIHDATQQNLAAARQAETAARSLNDAGDRLLTLIGAVRENGRRR